MAKFPFSYEFFAQCMHNFVTREEHFLKDENLDLPSLFASKINFLVLSKRYKYNKKLLERLGLDGFLELPLTNENIKVPDEFKTLLDKIITEVSVAEGCDGSSPAVLNFIQLVKKNLNLWIKY